LYNYYSFNIESAIPGFLLRRKIISPCMNRPKSATHFCQEHRLAALPAWAETNLRGLPPHHPFPSVDRAGHGVTFFDEA
jgi:hypothetical protein